MPHSEEKRRILIAHPGAELYGSDRVTLDSATALVARGWAVTVVTPGRGPLTQALERAGAEVRVLDFPVLRKSALRPAGMVALVWQALRSLVPAIRLVVDRRPDVVYVATVTLPFWILISRLCRRVTVCHLHEAEVGAHRMVRKLLSLPTGWVHTVLANSEFTLGALTTELPRAKFATKVILNPITPPIESTGAREELQDGVDVLFVGRISPRKGPQVAVESLARLVADGTDVRLGLLGDVFEGYEWFERELEELAERLDVAERVSHLGFRPDVWPLLARADIVVVPSIDPEGFGNTAVEAVIAGRPVVASSAGGLREAIEGYKSALLVVPGSVESLADALGRIIHDWPDYRRWAHESSDQARKRHSFDTYGDQLQEVLSQSVDRVTSTGGPLRRTKLRRPASEERTRR